MKKPKCTVCNKGKLIFTKIVTYYDEFYVWTCDSCEDRELKKEVTEKNIKGGYA